MARGKGEPPAYKVHSKGHAYVNLGGKQVYLGKHGTQKAKDRYKELIRQWERDNLGTVEVPKGGAKVITLIDAFMAYAKVHYRRKDGTQTNEYQSFRRSLAPLAKQHATMPVDEFRPRDLKAIRDQWIKSGLARKTVNQQVGRIRHCFRWGVAEELVEPSTSHALFAVSDLKAGKTEAPDHEETGPVPLRDFAKTLRELRPHYAAIARLQYYCGARPGEVCRMKGKEINRQGIARIKGRQVFVGEGVWVFQPERSKTGKVVYILGPRAQAVLKPFLRDDQDEYLFSARECKAAYSAERRARRKTPVQPYQIHRAKKNPLRAPGPHITPTTYAHQVQFAAARAGANHWHPHQLRHSFLTKVDRIAGIQTASNAVGHKSADTTLIYVETNLKDAADLLSKHG